MSGTCVGRRGVDDEQKVHMGGVTERTWEGVGYGCLQSPAVSFRPNAIGKREALGGFT